MSGDHLTDQTAPPVSERGADGYFLMPVRGAGQLQVGKIRAHDPHHYANSASQRQESRAKTSGNSPGRSHRLVRGLTFTVL